LSRPACSHVKQVAKRPGTREPGQDFFLGRFFIGRLPAKEVRMPASPDRKFRPETRLLHAGSLRSQFGETSEALFLTQGFVYDSAEACEARFKGEEPGYL
jgi:hypothetical protein